MATVTFENSHGTTGSRLDGHRGCVPLDAFGALGRALHRSPTESRQKAVIALFTIIQAGTRHAPIGAGS